MELLLLGAAVALLLIAVLVYWRSRAAGAKEQALALFQQQLDAMRQQVDTRLGQLVDQMLATQRNVGDKLDSAARMWGDVQRGLGEVSEASKQMLKVGEDISSLQEILRPPKLRGGLAESLLENLLSDILPPTYFSLQHQFRSGEKVDAVVRVGSRLVPVDAKFPLENFKRLLDCTAEEEKKDWQRRFASDVKRHIDDIAKKYILPDEDTFDFALMYIPAENVYYETIVREESFGEGKSIADYALSRHVFPVSPNNFYAYLLTISFGLRGLRIEEHAKEIVDGLGRLRGDFERFQEDFRILGTHLTQASKKFDDAQRRLERFEDKLLKVEAPEEAIEVIETPLEDSRLLT